ncbi:hypothetical protein ES703_86133 [subsurface metagenome]
MSRRYSVTMKGNNSNKRERVLFTGWELQILVDLVGEHMNCQVGEKNVKPELAHLYYKVARAKKRAAKVRLPA